MDPVKLTPGQQRVVDEAPLRQEIARLKRERDEARAQRDALIKAANAINQAIDELYSVTPDLHDARVMLRRALAELQEERGAESMRRYIEQGGENG